MTIITTYHARRRALEASFDGPIPRDRLVAPLPPRKPADASTIMRTIADRRRRLTAVAARSDSILAGLNRHLMWLVKNDRRSNQAQTT